MKSRISRIALTAVTAALLALMFMPRGAWAGDYRDSIFRVMVACQTFDPFFPWQKSAPGMKYGYGILIDGARVLTTEDLVRNHTMVELQKSQDGERFTAVVELADESANLAILRIVESGKMGNLEPLTTAPSLPKDAKVKIVQFDDTGAISQGNGQVVEVSVAQLPQTRSSSLTFKLLTDMNVNGRGAAAILDGRIAGLFISYDRSTRIGEVVPSATLRRFVDDESAPQYRGFANAGFTWSPLVDPDERSFLRAPSNKLGIVVLTTIPGTGASESLLPQDVILEWDGVSIDERGFYEDPDFGQLAFPHLVKGRRYPGDVVAVKLIRKRLPMTVNVRLVRQLDEQALIPENTAGRQAEYLVEGGLVIRELTGDYLRGYGNGWNIHADARLVHLYLTQALKPGKKGDRILILSQVLPDPVNVGYQNLRDQVITSVNGEPVRNLADVFTIVRRVGYIQRLRLQSAGIDLVLDPAKLPSANRRLAELYQIPSLSFERKTDTTDQSKKPGLKQNEGK